MLLDHPLPLLPWTLVLGVTFIAALVDARWRLIPNLLTAPLVVAGLTSAAAVGGWGGVGEAALAGVVVASPFAVLFAVGGGGAGDAKLMAGVGACLGLRTGALALLAVSLSGVVLALAFAARRRRLETALANVASIARGALLPGVGVGSWHDVRDLVSSADDGQKMPYGLAIFLGCVAAATLWAWGVR